MIPLIRMQILNDKSNSINVINLALFHVKINNCHHLQQGNSCYQVFTIVSIMIFLQSNICPIVMLSRKLVIHPLSSVVSSKELPVFPSDSDWMQGLSSGSTINTITSTQVRPDPFMQYIQSYLNCWIHSLESKRRETA